MLALYNTLSKQKEEFVPLEAKHVKLYSCGPTVYDYVHIGNLRTYVAVDTLRRVLEHLGFSVRHVKNITDVGHLTRDDMNQGDTGEDKIAEKARKEAKTPEEIADFFTQYYKETEEKLNILPAHEEPRATHYIADMIALIEKLIQEGHAYEKNGNVFFDVTSFKGYGKLSGNTLEKLKVGARLEEHPDKNNPWDFALWLKAPEGHLMHWESPWSIGYPGWHIECSAMNVATLGPTIDIHTGGEDNIFPHHEAEIAQSESVNHAPLARYWVHARHLLVEGTKMSKSKGNFYTLEHVSERGFTPMDLRLAFLGAHYRSQMNFTWDVMEQAKSNRSSLENAIARLNQYLKEGKWGTMKALVEQTRTNFISALEDDLNTPLALSIVFGLATESNRLIDGRQLENPADVHKFLLDALSLLGLEILGEQYETATPSEITRLISEREAARHNKDFKRSDELRDEIASLGFLVEDTKDGQRVRRI